MSGRRLRLSLRPAGPGDAPGLARVHADAWTAAYGGIIPPDALARFDYQHRLFLWTHLLADPARLPWVDLALPQAMESEKARERIAGFVWSRLVDQPGAAFRSEIVGLAVHPDHWRSGLGRRLIGTAALRLREAGASSAYLWVFRDNHRARAFYEALGGRIVDEDSERLGEITLPTLAYGWKSLSPLLRHAGAAVGGGREPFR